MVAVLVFIDSFWPKKLLDAKGPSGSDVFKNPARYVGFHMTSLKFKLKNYRSYRDFTFTMY